MQRLALRGWDTPVPDEEDRIERDRTRYVLRNGAAALILPVLRCLVESPVRFCAAFRAAVKMSRLSRARPLFYHLTYLAEACVILAWLRASGARHLHAHFGTNSAEVAMLTRALGGPPFSFTVHGPEEFLQPMGLPEKISASAFVVAISSYGRSQLYLRLPHEIGPKCMSCTVVWSRGSTTGCRYRCQGHRFCLRGTSERRKGSGTAPRSGCALDREGNSDRTRPGGRRFATAGVRDTDRKAPARWPCSDYRLDQQYKCA